MSHESHSSVSSDTISSQTSKVSDEYNDARMCAVEAMLALHQPDTPGTHRYLAEFQRLGQYAHEEHTIILIQSVWRRALAHREVEMRALIMQVCCT